MTSAGIDDLLRPLVPSVLGVLTRRTGDFDAADDAVQEALVAAAERWPVQGVPANPTGWLITVALRRLTDAWRSEASRRQRELHVAWLEPASAELAGEPEDDTLILVYMCCHPALTETSQIALTLRAVGGLTTAEIARAFLVPESTMGQRISRAKQTIKSEAIPFRLPDEHDRADRLQVVLHVLYLIFNEGYTSTAGDALLRTDLTGEAIRLTRELRRLLPENGEVAGLLALMLLTDARRPARVRPDGGLIPLAEQNRNHWNQQAIAEGVALIQGALAGSELGPFQLQAAIAALHDEAESAQQTDWPQILALYELLDRMSPNPVVTLNRAVATAMVAGPAAGLALLAQLDHDLRLTGSHRLDAVRGHLLEMAGDLPGAIAHYRAAALKTTSVPEQRYLTERATRLESAES